MVAINKNTNVVKYQYSFMGFSIVNAKKKATTKDMTGIRSKE
jgi:hypothetical protein